MTSTLKVLCIDDDEIDRISIARTLKQTEIAVQLVQTATAADGLAAAAAQHFDIILLDFHLPDRDGLAVLKTLREDVDRHATVIMLSRREDDALVQQAIDAGAQDFLLKDEVTPRRLVRAMRQSQYRSRLEDALSRIRENLRELAEQDALTGLANRYDFERVLALAVARGRRDGSRLAVLLLDVDNFKTVNDTFGHAVGDQLLVEVARRLGSVVRDSDMLARLGGDEFVILAQNMERDEQATLLAKRIIACFAEPMVLGEIQWTVTTSIGIAVFGDYTNNPSDLMRCADIAMYRAKQGGRNQSRFYSEQLHLAVQQQAALERDLRKALASQQLHVYYQAQVHAHDGSLGGLEALVRWEHPTMGTLAPGVFLPMAEELGLMREIGQWVLHQSCLQLQDWRSRICLDGVRLAVAVNLSAVELQGNDLPDKLQAALSDSGLPAACLELEITESVLIRDPEITATMLKKVAALGVQLALDDFGTGYSSFEHLQLFPIHSLKIDRRFVDGIGQGAVPERLLTAMIRFARTLNLNVVAEGIETAEQAQFCNAHGCDLLQGYYFSRPVPAAQFEAQFLAKLANQPRQANPAQ